MIDIEGGFFLVWKLSAITCYGKGNVAFAMCYLIEKKLKTLYDQKSTEASRNILISDLTQALEAKMDDEMVTLHNVMPVDLAIKREMEYRHKMEALKNQPLNNLNPLLPSQVHPTSRTTLKRKEPSTSGIKLKKQATGLVCKICEITFCTVGQMKDHSNSLKHKHIVQQLKKRGQNVSTPFLCELCNSSCSSGIVMAVHLKGTKHAAVLQEVEKAKRARAKEGFGPRRY
ncbi:unnamed protein product [Lactuca saligna]|uniref:C2H2-type domain-containing protein n=1 Tax=Lactuca saligna TaxID=75948 RepID=A0AA36DYN5_LACSI|nr:unnamed protein product [Lactuca saligna]